MFKKLREKLAEEVTNARITVNNSNSLQNLSNIISSSNNNGEKPSEEIPSMSSAASMDAFSITEEEDASPMNQSNDDQSHSFQNVDLSEASVYSTPKEKSGSSSSLFQEGHFLPTYTPTLSHHSIQSDLESASEYEDSSSTLEKISKEQLFHSFMRMRSRYTMCRAKYKDVVKAYKEQANEKEKIKSILSESQDKALRRISELKEESLLAKHAKADMEDNFRIMLEEKDEVIHVLQTQIKLLKDGVSTDDSKLDPSMALILDKMASENSLVDIETKKNEFIDPEKDDSQYKLLDNKIKELEEQLETMKIQEREAALSMAETKRQMHEELEQKEQTIVKIKNEIDQLTKTVEEKDKLIKETEDLRQQDISAIKEELVNAEKTLEEEKQALVQELSRGKTAAIGLLKEQFEQKIAELNKEKEATIASEKTLHEKEKKSLTEKFEKKIQELIIEKTNEKEHALHLKDEEVRRKLVEKQEEMNLALEERDLQKLAALSAQDLKIDEFHLCIKQLKKDKNELRDSLRNLEIQNDENQKRLLQQIEETKTERDLYCQEQQSKINHLEKKLSEMKQEEESFAEMESVKLNLENLLHEKDKQLISAELLVKQLKQSLAEVQEEICNNINQAKKQEEMWNNEKKRYAEEHEKALEELKNMKNINESFQTHFENLLTMISKISQEKETWKGEITELNNKMLSYQHKIKDLLSQIRAVEIAKNKTIEDLNKELENNKQEESYLQKQIEQLMHENNQLQHVLDEAKLGNETLKNVLENLQIAAAEQNQQYTSEITELKNNILVLERDKKNILNILQLKEEQIVKMNNELTQSQDSLKSKEMQFSLAVSERMAAEESIREAYHQLEEEKSKSWMEKDELLEKLNNCKSKDQTCELNKVKQQLNSVIEEKNVLSDVTEKLEKEAVNAEIELREKNEALEIIRREVESKDTVLDELQRQKDEAMILLSCTETKLLEVNESISAKMEMMENRDAVLRQELDSLRQQMKFNNESYQEDLEKFRMDLEISAKRLNEMENEKLSLEYQIQMLHSELNLKEGELNAVKKQVEIEEKQKCEEEKISNRKKMNEFILYVSEQLDLKQSLEEDKPLEEILQTLFEIVHQRIKMIQNENETLKKYIDEYKCNIEMKEDELIKLKEFNNNQILKIKNCVNSTVKCMHTAFNDLTTEVKQQNENFNKYKKELQNEFNFKLQSVKDTVDDEKLILEKELKLSKEKENILCGLLEECKAQLKEYQKDNEHLNIVLGELSDETNKMKINFLQDLEASYEQSNILKKNIHEKEIGLRELTKRRNQLEMEMANQHQQLEQEIQKSEMKLELDKYQQDLEEVENYWKKVIDHERQTFQMQLAALEMQKSDISQDSENKIKELLAEKNNLIIELEDIKLLKIELENKLQNVILEFEAAKENMQNLTLNNADLCEKIKTLHNNNDSLETSLHACKQCIKNLALGMRKKINVLKQELSVFKEAVIEGRNSCLTLEREQTDKVLEMTQLLLKQMEYINYLKSKISQFEKELTGREIINCNLASDFENANKELDFKNEQLVILSTTNDTLQNDVLELRKKIEELETTSETLTETHAAEIEKMQQSHSTNVNLQLNELKKRAEVKLGQIKRQIQITKDEEVSVIRNEKKMLEQEIKSLKEDYQAKIEKQTVENNEACHLLKDQINLLEKKVSDLENGHRNSIKEVSSQKDKIIDELSSHCSLLKEKINELEKNVETEKVNLQDALSKRISLKDVDIQCSLGTNIKQAEQGKNITFQNAENAVDSHVNFRNVIEDISCRKKEIEELENSFFANENLLHSKKLICLLKEENENLLTVLNKQNVEIAALTKNLDGSLDNNNEINKINDNEIDKYKELNSLLSEQNNALKDEIKKLKVSYEDNSEINRIIANYEEKLSLVEEEHNQKIKQLARDFSVQMEKKDEEFDDRISELVSKEHQEKARLLVEYKKQITEIQENVEQKEDSMEKILQTERVDFKKREEKLKNIINDYEEKLNYIQDQHKYELENLEKHWKTILTKQQQKLTEKHEEEVQGLTEEWKKERMPQNQEKLMYELQHETKQMKTNSELERENMLTMAAITSGSDTNELLRKQIISLNSQMNHVKQQYQAEIDELRGLLQSVNNNAVRGNSYRFQETMHLGPLLTESTEIEYLRNILFHYMMGRQTLTLAKVIAAVVKFSDEQTKEILEKEETKNSMLLNFLKSS